MNPCDNADALLRTLSAPRRNKYFYGKRMDVQHFQMEQDYGKLKQWLLNRLTLGKGVLCGLRVSVDAGRVCVSPGVAIDGLGREIIVPVRSCLLPVVQDDGCCGGGCGGHAPTPTPAPAEAGLVDGVFALWLCYNECLADRQPVMVSECGSRDECAAGTTVESYCLKVTADLPPMLGDPEWCANLWPLTPPPPPGPNAPQPGTPLEQALAAARASRRHMLCELFDCGCQPNEEDACVPLALITIRNGEISTESCVVRPRIYSNQKLLDLILCLADKIDDCCGQHQDTPLQVVAIDFLRRTTAGDAVVASVASPTQDTLVSIDGLTNAIRIRFNKPYATNQHQPTTHGQNDADFNLHNVQVLPLPGNTALPYVPGSLQLVAPDTIRFDLAPDSPYSRGAQGWQKGQYRIFLRGTEDLAQNRQALADATDRPFDGEPIAPVGGVMSGDGTPGGDFSTTFTVGGGVTTPALLRVASVDFLDITGQRRGSIQTPQLTTQVEGAIQSVVIKFNTPYLQAGPHLPTTHGLDDPNFLLHNVQVRVDPSQARQLGTAYVPGTLSMPAPDTLRFDVVLGSRVVNPQGIWTLGSSEQGSRCQLFLRGTPTSTVQHAALANLASLALDGEPIAPAGGLMSGDGTAGGDFIASFTVTHTIIN